MSCVIFASVGASDVVPEQPAITTASDIIRIIRMLLSTASLLDLSPRLALVREGAGYITRGIRAARNAGRHIVVRVAILFTRARA